MLGDLELVDAAHRERLTRRFGPGVTTWMDELPGLVARLSARWGLRVDRLMPGGTSCTYMCTRDGTTPVVLKMTPERDIALGEYRALRAWDAVPAAAGVLDADLESGALLLEAIEPGTPVDGLLLGPLADLLGALHVPAEGFIPLRERVDFVFGLLRTRTDRDISAFHQAAANLASDRFEPVLLHGDLHFGNLLDGGPRGPVAIDPRPCLGDPAVDAVDFVYAGPDHDARIEALSVVVDGDRLRLWCDAFAPFFP